MALALKSKPAAAKAGGAPKLAGLKKPGKAAAGGKAKAAPGPAYKEGQVVEFVGYADESREEPVFAAGDRLTIVKKGKDENGTTIYDAVKEEDFEAFNADNDSVTGDQVLASEIKKAEKAPVDPYAIGEVVSLGKLDEVLAEHNGDALEAAQAMQEEAAENLFVFGGLLAKLYSNQAFREYGDEYKDEEVDGKVKYGTGWNKFTQDNFNMGGRDASRHINIYMKFAGLDLDWSAISRNKKIGYVKLDAMARVVNKDNVQELLEKAQEANVEEFKATIRTDYVTEGEARQGAAPKVKRTTFSFKLFEDQGEGVKYVMDAAKKALGIEDDNQVFELIAMQWAATYLPDTVLNKARAAKRKVHKALKAQGVNIDALLAADSKLEESLVVDDGEASTEGGETAEG